MAESILGRIGQLLRANVNAILDEAEDPEKMLDQLVRDYTSNIAEAESAVAQTVGNLRLLEDDQKEAKSAVGEWGQKAGVASKKADELRVQPATRHGDCDQASPAGAGPLARPSRFATRKIDLSAACLTMRRRLDVLHASARRKILRRDVGPRLSIVARDVEWSSGDIIKVGAKIV